MNFDKIFEAYEFAKEAHKGQKRKSGEDYINHSKAAATTGSRYSRDDNMICALLLHDVPEDTRFTLEDIQEKFGEEIAFLVDGVTKVETEERTMKKVEAYTKKDKRVILIKLADRLDNLKRPVNPEEREGLREAFARYKKSTDFYIALGRKYGFNILAESVEQASRVLI